MEAMQESLEIMEEVLRKHHQQEVQERHRLCAMTAQEAGERTAEKANGEQQRVLQTYTVPLAAVKKSVEEWLPSIREEYQQLTEKTGTIQRITEAEARTLPGFGEAEFAPCKMVNTIKAPHGKHRSRIVLCGNLVEAMNAGQERESLSKQDLYAGGIDGVALRCALRRAAHNGWSVGTIDVKTAFLLAPRTKSQRMLLSRPPRLLIDNGVCPRDELWMVNTAMYGLETSPADWSCYRDSILKDFKWSAEGRNFELQATPENNLWTVWDVSEDGTRKAAGNLVVYVDDLLIIGDDGAAKALMQKIQSVWKCSDPEWVDDKGWVKFCGFEIRRKGGSLLVGQPSYIKELLNRHQVNTTKSVPFAKMDEETMESSEEVDPGLLRQAQGIVGELLWVSIRTRPDISFGVAQMSQMISKRPGWVVRAGMDMLAYLAGTLETCLEYKKCEADDWGPEQSLAFPRSMMRLELHADASFSPNGDRSHHGVMAFYGGGLVQWESTRQPFAVLSSAEAELLGYIEGMIMGDSVAAVVECLDPLWSEAETHRVLYGDNQAAIAILTNIDGAWRTRHLRLRAFFLRERIRDQVWSMRHLRGEVLVSDFLTKPITVKNAWGRFRDSAGLTSASYDLGDEARLSRVTKLAGLALVTGILGRIVKEGQGRLASLAALTCGLVAAGRCLRREPRPAQEARMGNQEPSGQPKEDQKSSREDEPEPKFRRLRTEHQCPSGFPGSSRVGLRAMESLDGQGDDVATFGMDELKRGVEVSRRGQADECRVLKTLRLRRSLFDDSAMTLPGPWRNQQYKEPPKRLSDKWEYTEWMGHPWYVRHHGMLRRSLFHPLHSATPVPPKDLAPVRYTVLFNQDGTKEEIKDRWDRSRCGGREGTWRGYTFFAAHTGDTDEAEEEANAEVQTQPKAPGNQLPVRPTRPRPKSWSSSKASGSSYNRGTLADKGRAATMPYAPSAPSVQINVTVTSSEARVHELGNASPLTSMPRDAGNRSEDHDSGWEEV